jgi:hypothetical protein
MTNYINVVAVKATFPAPKFWNTMEIRANARKNQEISGDKSENKLNSSNFITILHKNSGKLSTALLESISPVRLR